MNELTSLQDVLDGGDCLHLCLTFLSKLFLGSSFCSVFASVVARGGDGCHDFGVLCLLLSTKIAWRWNVPRRDQAGKIFRAIPKIFWFIWFFQFTNEVIVSYYLSLHVSTRTAQESLGWFSLKLALYHDPLSHSRQVHHRQKTSSLRSIIVILTQ